MAAATDRLLRSVDGLTEEDLPGPSLLPGWTRAHVLTHVARNADGLVNLVHAARTGEGREMYQGGQAGREAAIEAGLGRHLGDLRLDLSDSAERLLEAFADFPAEGLAREVTMTSGATAYGWEIPFAADPRGRDPPRGPGRGLHPRATGTPSSPPAPSTSSRRSSGRSGTARWGSWRRPTATGGGRWPPRVPT